LSSEFKIFNTSYALYLAVLGSMIHGLSVPGAIEAAQRRRGFNNGVFEWLRKAPWGNPAFSGVALSIVMFGFLGGISGVVMGTEQLNLIMHNTLYVPGHFHGTVVAGTTLAFMAVTYLVVPLIFRRDLILKGLAKWQPYLFGIGVAGISVFMMGAGTLGVARRHWDMTFSDAPMSFEYPAAAFMMMGLNGISAIMAAVGGILFIVIIVGSVLFGKPRDAATIQAAPAIGTGGADAVASYGGEDTVKLPGTITLVAVFLISFILYYYVNWKYLSEIWPLS
jgi:cytochrome c oxidase subunit 1